jgi:preprotein translocase subunit SecA
LAEIEQTAKTIFPLDSKMSADILNMSGEHAKLDKIMVRTKIIDTLVAEAKIKYAQAGKITEEVGMSWKEVEKNILLRSMDLLWIEHLETMDYMRRGIGLRGYGQHDPLVEYKKEAFRMYSELNTLIQKEVVYSIFKVGGIGQMMSANVFGRQQKFTAPAKEMTETNSGFAGLSGGEGDHSGVSLGLNLARDKAKDAQGHKIGRNDPCPCGATNSDGTSIKYKNCHGK